MKRERLPPLLGVDTEVFQPVVDEAMLSLGVLREETIDSQVCRLEIATINALSWRRSPIRKGATGIANSNALSTRRSTRHNI